MRTLIGKSVLRHYALRSCGLTKKFALMSASIAAAGASLTLLASPAGASTYDFNFNQIYYVNCPLSARGGCVSGTSVSATAQNTFGQTTNAAGYYQGNGANPSTTGNPLDPSSAITNTIAAQNLYVLDSGGNFTTSYLSSANGHDNYIFSNGTTSPGETTQTAYPGQYFGSQLAAFGISSVGGSTPYIRYIVGGVNTAFSLTSIDFELGPGFGSPTSLTVEGFLNGNPVMGDLVTIALTSTLTTHTFNWGNIDTIEFINGTWGAYNNVIICTSNCVTATPLPAALPLFATGLGTLGLIGWRKKRKAQAV